MADIAGVAIGVAALWQACIQVYEIVDSTRQHGMEFELLMVKFEVERVRLLCWGDAVGLGGVRTGGAVTTPEATSPSSPTSLDVRLRREEVRSAVMRLLGCIQHVFENTDRLQDRYGLQVATAVDQSGTVVTVRGHVGVQGLTPSQNHRILNGVFRRAYGSLHRAAADRQQAAPLGRRTLWAVRDRSKFEKFVSELRGYNNSLESLFPDAQVRAVGAMRAEIEGAVDVRELQLLQEATSEGNRVLSECASLRLEALGATISERTGLLSISTAQKEASSQGTAERVAVEDKWEDADEEITRDDAEVGGQAAAAQPEPEVDEMTKRMREMEAYIGRKSLGALTLSLIGPYAVRVSAHVYWDGDESDATFPSTLWKDMRKGFVTTTHASFGKPICHTLLLTLFADKRLDMYKKRKYFRKLNRDKYEGPDSEDYVLLDPEAHLKYEHEYPGTVTVEGYGMECWEFETTKPSKRDLTIMVNYSDLPTLRAKTLLRRVDELQHRPGKFGWHPEKEELDLKAMVGGLG